MQPTDFGRLVLQTFVHSTRETGSVNQSLLRHCFGLTSSYLITDVSMNPDNGLGSWDAGFNRLVDVLVALHVRGELEVETMSEASKACSECWSVAGSHKSLDNSRTLVRAVALRLRSLVPDGKYKGHTIYSPSAK